MKKIFATLIPFLIVLPVFAAGAKLKTILAIRPGESLRKIQKTNAGLKLNDNLKGADYSIQVEGDVIQSIQIDFSSPVDSQKYVNTNAKGNCLVQAMPGDLVISRYFFFDSGANTRYELTPKGMIKSILIRDIPGARENRKCQFSEVIPKENTNQKILKVK